MYSYNINDVSILLRYRRTTIIIDGGECLVGEEGDRNVYVHTRNHSVVSLATDEIVLNVFGNKPVSYTHLANLWKSGISSILDKIHESRMVKIVVSYRSEYEKLSLIHI